MSALIRRTKLKHRVLAIFVMVMIALCILGFVSAPRKVTVIADGSIQQIITRSSSPRDALLDAGVTLEKGDGYRLKSKTGDVRDGAEIEVFRAIPVRIWKNGQEREYLIGRATVGETLEAAGVSYAACRVFPELQSRPAEGMLISVTGPNSRFISEQEPIPFGVETRDDDSIPQGTTQVVSKGSPGVLECVYNIPPQGSEDQYKHIISSRVLHHPSPKVILRGTGTNLVAHGSGFARYTRIMDVEATAYTLAEGSGTGRTSTGIVPYEGVIAVDPDVIPYHTKVYVPGYGMAVAEDCGGAIEGNKIDLFMHDIQRAKKWGRKKIQIYILE